MLKKFMIIAAIGIGGMLFLKDFLGTEKGYEYLVERSDSSDPGLSPTLFYYMGEWSSFINEPQRAYRCFEVIASTYPKSGRGKIALYRMAVSKEEIGMDREAYDIYKRYAELYPDDVTLGPKVRTKINLFSQRYGS